MIFTLLSTFCKGKHINNKKYKWKQREQKPTNRLSLCSNCHPWGRKGFWCPWKSHFFLTLVKVLLFFTSPSFPSSLSPVRPRSLSFDLFCHVLRWSTLLNHEIGRKKWLRQIENDFPPVFFLFLSWCSKTRLATLARWKKSFAELSLNCR